MQKIKLDKYQKKVIKNKSKNLLVIAGAGSGKTLTIIYKIKHLIKNNINPNDILCITFTKAAAQNLQNKLIKENITLSVKTFHSLGYQIIKNNRQIHLVNETTLDEIIMKYLKTSKNLNQIISKQFIKIGKGNTDILENEILKQTKYIIYLKENIKTFINLFKSNNYPINSFDNFHKQNKKNNSIKKQKRHKHFLNLTKKIYLNYQETLNDLNQIDFHDMINIANEIVKKENIYPYKYIIIDEYQDTSKNKCELVKTIQKQTNSKLIAVGDDWQSIYRFTGSNLEIFTNFKKYFPHAKIIKLKNTYRISEEIIQVTKKFVMKNPSQINKKIISNKNLKTPIHIYYYNNNLKEVWKKICKETNKQTLVLSRNNSDIKKIPYLNKHMTFMTIHKSKGLEAESVIIINLENTVTSLPSKLQDSEYLMYVKPQNNKYPYDEERRLFYVALTRTKTNVKLLVNKDNPSIFILELLKNSPKYIKIFTN